MWNSTSQSTPGSPTAASPTASKPSYRLKHQGKRIAQIVKLKPEHVAEYKACHARVWPEVLKQIKDCNIEDCKDGSLSTIILADGLVLSSEVGGLC